MHSNAALDVLEEVDVRLLREQLRTVDALACDQRLTQRQRMHLEGLANFLSRLLAPLESKGRPRRMRRDGRG